MKKFILGFIVGTIIMVIAGQFWGSNPITSNPFTLWCDKLVDKAEAIGNVGVTITQNGQPVSNLTVNLSVEQPPRADYPGARPGEFMIPKKACFIGTNQKGMGTFNKVPAGNAYIFFNNDPASYPKRFGKPNFSITTVVVKGGETSTAVIDLNPKD